MLDGGADATDLNERQERTVRQEVANIVDTMLVIETIMPPNMCNLYPSSNSIHFTDVSVNGGAALWQTSTGMDDCAQSVGVASGGEVDFSWQSS